jgi:hypothetical protein
MKFLKVFFLIATLSIVTACGGDDDNDTPAAAFQMDVDGETVSFEALAVVSQMTNDNKYIAITAADPGTFTGAAVAVGSIDSEADLLAEGTYETSDTTHTQISYALNGDSFGTFGEGGSGTVIITTLDTEAKTISGTFSGTVTNLDGSVSFEVTNGQFNNLTYTEN